MKKILVINLGSTSSKLSYYLSAMEQGADERSISEKKEEVSAAFDAVSRRMGPFRPHWMTTCWGTSWLPAQSMPGVFVKGRPSSAGNK